MKSKTILIVGAGEMQIPIIRKCHELGLKTIVTDGSPEAPGLKEANIGLVVDTLDAEGTLQVAIKHEVDGVITTSDYPVRTVAYICEKLKLNGLSIRAAEISTNKFLQREKMKKHGFSVPQFFTLENALDIENIKNKLTYPLIVKPFDSSASRGVSKVTTKDELRDAYIFAQSYSHNGQVIVESFIEGNEYSVECLIQNERIEIVAITEKTILNKGKDCFVEDRHIIPAHFSFKTEKKIKEYVKSIITIFSLNNCAAHVEIKVSDSKTMLIELGARLGGDFITSQLVPLAYGVDMQKNIIHIALGEGLDVQKRKSCFAGVQFLNSENYKKAQEYVIKNPKGIVESVFKSFESKQIKSSLDRLGYVIITTDSREELLKKLNFER